MHIFDAIKYHVHVCYSCCNWMTCASVGGFLVEKQSLIRSFGELTFRKWCGPVYVMHKWRKVRNLNFKKLIFNFCNWKKKKFLHTHVCIQLYIVSLLSRAPKENLILFFLLFTSKLHYTLSSLPSHSLLTFSFSKSFLHCFFLQSTRVSLSPFFSY